MAYRCAIIQMTTFFRRELVERIGSFDIQFKYAMDYDYWLRAVAAFPDSIAYLPEPLACYRFHDQSQSARDILPALFDEIAVRRKLVTAEPQPEWLKPIRADIFRGPLTRLLANATDEAAFPVVVAYLRKTLGEKGFGEDEWEVLGQFLVSPISAPQIETRGLEILAKIESAWLDVCAGAGRRSSKWLADTLVELGWRHMRAAHVGRGLGLFRRAFGIRPAAINKVVRWRLIETLLRAKIDHSTFLYLRGIKRKVKAIFYPTING